MTSIRVPLAAVCLTLVVAVPARAQTLAEASAEAERLTQAWVLAHPTSKAPKVYTNHDLPGHPAPTLPVGLADRGQPTTFSPTADNIFVCKAKSMKALFKAVDAEHNGYFTQQFANFKLRDSPSLTAAAKADAASCDQGSYMGAMEKALKAEADEQARLQGLLRQGLK